MANTERSMYRYAGVPGKSRVLVTIITESAPDPTITGADGIVRPVYAQPLAQVVQVLGGYEGYLRDPLAGQMLHLDLTRWANADPDKTRVVLGWQFSPKHPVAAKHRPLFDQWALTHDRYPTITEDAPVKVFDGTTPFRLIHSEP